MSSDILQNGSLPRALGSELKHRRKQKGWSQEELAAAAGVDRRYMSDVELGKRNISLEVLCKIAAALGMRTSSLLALAEKRKMSFTTLSDLKEWLCEEGLEDTVVFENPDYISAVLGASHDGRVIYSYPLMVSYLMESEGMKSEEAAEFIDYNTVRALPYMGKNAPIICYDVI